MNNEYNEFRELAESEVALGIGGEILLGGTSKRLERKARPEGTLPLIILIAIIDK